MTSMVTTCLLAVTRMEKGVYFGSRLKGVMVMMIEEAADHIVFTVKRQREMKVDAKPTFSFF